MSGGAYNYAFSHVNDFKMSLAFRATTPLRRAFMRHLEKVSDAMHAIEWEDSGDYGEGRSEEYIETALGASANEFLLTDAIEQLRTAIKEAEDIYEKVRQAEAH